MPSADETAVKLITSLATVDADDWNACANPDPVTFNPFVSHAFLRALEDSGSVGTGTGWYPRHLLIEDENGHVSAAAPAYAKAHSQGEYVFDHNWAEAYTQAGGRYYPKLLVAVPFTPVPGPRLLVKPGARANSDEQLLAAAAIEVARQNGLSSVHMTFLTKETAERLQALGFLLRTGQQFHWHNRGYGSFDDFLSTLSSRKRKAIRKEREAARAPGIEIEEVTGSAITEAHWDAMFAFYMDTGDRKWGRPYLNRAFFSEIGRTMPEHCLLIMAKRNGTYIAGALNLIGGDCLFGRYWGAIEHIPALHYEVCYYQAIDFAIRHKLPRVEAGAQGEHKLARGYLPVETYSAHWIADPAFRRAVEQALRRERDMVSRYNADLTDLGPYRKDES
ncbi:GNAT family N-acetyltransferase [Hyphomicrobium methylovorum]|uniref:GNAT family N-acetyltransferase n=1 Tax=Hyphomicrobium methylovorum TaxID=84 RepID=UPI0015E6951A|nr:GNAT family N-acetyltransferase [Hyphomicrobium methylovorum]MBA2127141.1 GNAT family N-acetyltransferase [Hyphomicrobium methylovorum]